MSVYTAPPATAQAEPMASSHRSVVPDSWRCAQPQHARAFVPSKQHLQTMREAGSHAPSPSAAALRPCQSLVRPLYSIIELFSFPASTISRQQYDETNRRAQLVFIRHTDQTHSERMGDYDEEDFEVLAAC